MKKAIMVGLLLIAVGFSQGCITAGAYIVGRTVYGVTEKRNTVGMNYHAEPPAVWNAAQVELASMGQEPESGAKLKKNKGELKAKDVKVRIEPIKGSQGTRVNVVTDLDKYVNVQRARTLLNRIADSLGESDEVVQDFRASLQDTYAAALEQVKAMGYSTGRGTLLEEKTAKIRVKDTIIALESLEPDVTRVHIVLAAAAPEATLELATYFLEGVQERLP
jgi:hypothetical protein